MKEIVYGLIILHVFVSSVNCLKGGKQIAKAAKAVDDLLPDIVSDVLHGANNGVIGAVKGGKKAAIDFITDKVIPISQLPLYSYRAENKIYDLSALKKHGPKFLKSSIISGTSLQRLAEYYGFFDMIDVKHVLCEFFYNSAEIVFYRGIANLSEKILKEVEELGVLKPEEIKPLHKLGFSKDAQAFSWWYHLDANKKFVNLMGNKIGAGNSGKGFSILTKEQVAIKQKYYKLTDDIALFVWHVLFTYEEELAPRENLVHQRLKNEQIQGHIMGNSFALSMLNDSVNFQDIRIKYLGRDALNTEKLKKKIREFIERIGEIFTNGEFNPFENESKIKKAVYWILQKLGIIETENDLRSLYKYKLEVLVFVSKMLKRADLTVQKAEKIIELCVNHWKIVFYLHVSGTLTSTKPAPEFYNHHETEEEENSENTSDSDTLENETDKSSSFENFEYDSKEDPNSPRNRIVGNVDGALNVEDYSEFGDKTLEEKDQIAKLMEDKNPFRDLLRKCLLKVKLNMKDIREHLIDNFELICFYFLLNVEKCSFIKRSIRNINTYKLKKDGRIASRRHCDEHPKDCHKIEPKHYMLFLRKMTEIQGVSMGIVEYLILQSEENQSLVKLTAKQRQELKNYIKSLFSQHFYLRIFVSKEYQRALANYAVGKKDSKVAKLAVERAQQIKKGIGLMRPKPPVMDPRDMDAVLNPDNS